MEKSIIGYPKFIILCYNEAVGCVSCKGLEMNVYEVSCLCVVPKYQGKGIGTQTIKFVKERCSDWKKITLITPIKVKM